MENLKCFWKNINKPILTQMEIYNYYGLAQLLAWALKKDNYTISHFLNEK
jgi:hypothetical protein